MRPGFSDVPRLPRSPRIVPRISFPTISNSVTLAIRAMSAQAVEISAPREYFGAARTIFSDPSPDVCDRPGGRSEPSTETGPHQHEPLGPV